MVPTSPDTLTLQESADRLGVHYMTAYRYVRLGLLDAQKVGGSWQVGSDAIAAFEAGDGNGPVQAGAAAPWVERLTGRLVDGDSNGAWMVVESAMASGADARSVYIEMLAPAMVYVGEQWEQGVFDISVEHQASAIAMRIIGRLGPRFVRRGRKRGSLVVGAPRGEAHGLVSAMISDLMRLHGWDVRDLGASTPGESFIHAARSMSKLSGVGISVTNPENVDAAREACAEIRRELPGTPIVMGGTGILSGEHALSLGADCGAFTADQFHEFLIS